jgi:Ca2+-binding RTX toxin-like protein
MLGKRRFTQFGLALLLGGACACSGQQKGKGIDFDPAGFEGFDETHFDLLAADCILNAAGDMTLNLAANETAYLFKRAADLKVVANATIAGAECTTSATNKITINGSTGSEQVIIDYYSGVFAAATTSTPNIAIDLGAGAGDTVKIRGTAGADLVTLGTRGTTSYFSLNTVGVAARTFADISMAGVEIIKVSTGPGNDTITGQGGAAVGSTTALPVVALDGAISLTVWGGDDNDTITSGALSVGTHNVLYGGAGDDLFLQQAAFAADWILGGNGTDTVDYGIRTTGVRVTLGASTAAAAATGTLSCVAKTAINDNDSFQIFSDATHSKTFAYNKTGAGVAATGSITCVPTLSMSDNDAFVISDGAHAKRFYYQKTANVAATGTITCPLQSALSDNDWFVLHDGTHDVIFEYSVTTANVPAAHGGHMINIFSAVSTSDVATATAGAIHALYPATVNIDATATGSDAIVHLTNGTVGAAGNLAITNNAVAHGLATVGMQNGSSFTVSTANGLAGTVPIDIHAVTTANAVASATYTAIHGQHDATLFTIAATDPLGNSPTIALANQTVGTLGNVLIDITGIATTAITAGFANVGMATGSAGFSESAGNTAATATIIDISGATTAAQVCTTTYTAIHGVLTTLGVPATDPAGATTIALANNTVGAAGNVPIVLSTGAAFSAIGMRNGVTAATNDDGDLAGAEGDNINGEVENVIGSSAADTIDASQVDTVHVLMGMGGNDTLIGGVGHTNYLYGGTGDDKLYGGGIADFLFGGTGDDLLQGGLGNDTIDGGGVNCVTAVSVTPPVPFAPTACTPAIATPPTIGAGSDTLDYSDRAGAVYVDLTNLTNCTTHKMGEVSISECDVIVSGGTPVVASVKNIRGGGGDDTLIGDNRANIIWGGAGNDTIDGSYGNDALYGEAGNDNIRGGPEVNVSTNPVLTDDDYINGGTGKNTLNGGDGIDTIDSSSGSVDIVDCGAGDGDINVPSGTESPAVANCEF